MNGETPTEQHSRMVHIKETYQHIAVFLLLIHFGGGQMQETPPALKVVAMVGDDVVLPCQLEPPTDAVSMTVEWGRPDLDPRFVFVWHEGKELEVDQNKAYKQRASVSVSKLKQGDLSLTLTKVRLSDNGVYRCYIPTQGKEFFVELLVGSASPPGHSSAGLHKSSSGVLLDCKSEGWYPEPEVSWLDGEGKHLSAVKTETVRGPDGLYTVSSRLTVKEKLSNSFTCRVQQRNINQTRETNIYVSDEFFVVPSDCTSSVVFSVLFGLMFTVAVVLFVWKQRNLIAERKRHHENEEVREQLMNKNKETEDLKKENDKGKLEAELKEKEEELKEMRRVIEALEELEEEQKKQKELLLSQVKEAVRLEEENDRKVREVDKEINEKAGDKTANKAQGYLKLKELFMNAKEKQEENRRQQQDLQMSADKLLKKTFDGLKIVKERKNKVDQQMEKVKNQIEVMGNQSERRLKPEKEGEVEEVKCNFLE